MTLSVLIPVFNEAESIEELIARVRAVEVAKEIIVVDDASTDGTGSRLAALAGPDLLVIKHPSNKGKGAAVRTALAEAAGQAVVIQDADLEYDPADFPALLEPLVSGRADAVYGVRDLSAQPLARRLGNRFLTALTNVLFGAKLADMETCYKVLAIDVARALPLRAERFDIEPEITVALLRRRVRIAEVPIRYTPRARRKLDPWRDGPHALWTLVRLRLWG